MGIEAMDTPYAGLSGNGEPFDHCTALADSPVLASWIPGGVGPNGPRGRDMGPSQPHKPAHGRDRFTVLIVDDDDSIAELLADLLEGEGYRALIAHDGMSALDCARNERPDMVLSDCMMPGLSGTQLAVELRRSPATRSIALVLMSSSRPRDLTTANVPFLAKPFEIDDVLALVEHYSRGPVSAQLYGEG
jgi:CheY-like chemotaxis protein